MSDRLASGVLSHACSLYGGCPQSPFTGLVSRDVQELGISKACCCRAWTCQVHNLWGSEVLAKPAARRLRSYSGSL